MSSEIRWENSMEAALARAKQEDKPILLDFYNPGWIGCQQMDAVTYPNDKVAAHVHEHCIPLRIGHEDQPLAGQFKVKWTPRLFLLDQNGNSDHDVMGFLPPDELVPFIQLARAKQAFHNDRLDEATAILDEMLIESSASGSAAEAVFLHGVSDFKKNHDPKALKAVYRLLKFDYAQSAWARRAFPYWNL